MGIIIHISNFLCILSSKLFTIVGQGKYIIIEAEEKL